MAPGHRQCRSVQKGAEQAAEVCTVWFTKHRVGQIHTEHIHTGRDPFTRAAGRQQSDATSTLGWRWGEVGEDSHLGSLSKTHHTENAPHCHTFINGRIQFTCASWLSELKGLISPTSPCL